MLGVENQVFLAVPLPEQSKAAKNIATGFSSDYKYVLLCQSRKLNERQGLIHDFFPRNKAYCRVLHLAAYVYVFRKTLLTWSYFWCKRKKYKKT